MTYVDKMIQEAVDGGYEFVILEPMDVFAPAIMEFHRKHKRLVYNVDILLACLSKEYEWDSITSLEWFEYNVFPLTYMNNGPIFFDEFDQTYLTIDEE